MGTQEEEAVASDGLSGAVALVTGGAGGVARSIATLLGRRGASVCLIDLEDSQANAEAVRAVGARVMSVRGDVSNEDDVIRGFDEAEAQLGPVTVLVNAAAIALPLRPIVEYDRADWDRILTVNLTGTMLVMREALRRMYPRGTGSVVNVSSNVGKRGMPNMSAYVASKWAIIGLTQTAALESVSHGIRVNAVCPGPTPSPLLDRTMEAFGELEGTSAAAIEEWWREEAPMKRFVENAEVANAVVFLASAASSGMTGQALNVTGGVVMH